MAGEYQINYYFDYAKKLAKKSTMVKRHGCVITKNGKIISTGYNTNFHCKKNGHWSIHAEVAAIMSCNPLYLKNATLYVLRLGYENSPNELMSSTPCKNCEKVIRKYKIKNIFYSTSKNNIIVKKIN